MSRADLTGELARKIQEARRLDRMPRTPARTNRARDLMHYFSVTIGHDRQQAQAVVRALNGGEP